MDSIDANMGPTSLTLVFIPSSPNGCLGFINVLTVSDSKPLQWLRAIYKYVGNFILLKESMSARECLDQAIVYLVQHSWTFWSSSVLWKFSSKT